MAKLIGARLYIGGTNIPVIADSIEADPPVDVSNVQQVSTSTGVGSKGYQKLQDSLCEITFKCPSHYKGVDVLALIESVYDPVNGSTFVINDAETTWQYNDCFRSDRDKTSFNGDKSFGMTFSGSPT